jgi:hypothetical protein
MLQTKGEKMRVSPLVFLGVMVLVVGSIVAVDELQVGAQEKQTTATTASTIAPVYVPTEIEKLQLQVKQKDAQLAQQQYQFAQAQLQSAIGSFRAQSDAIVKAHGWPSDVEVDLNTLEFSERPKPPRPGPPAPPMEKP